MNITFLTSRAENSNLLAEFEEAFKETMSTLTQEDTMFDRSPETLQHELENKVLLFTGGGMDGGTIGL